MVMVEPVMVDTLLMPLLDMLSVVVSGFVRIVPPLMVDTLLMALLDMLRVQGIMTLVPCSVSVPAELLMVGTLLMALLDMLMGDFMTMLGVP